MNKPEKVWLIESKILGLNVEIDEETTNIRQMLTDRVLDKLVELREAVSDVGEFDLLFAKAIFGRNYKCCIPEICLDTDNHPLSPSQRGNSFEGKQIFDISMMSELKKINIEYQKIDIIIDQTVSVITGSNMGGKTSVLNIIAQIAMMVKLGIPVPAEKLSIRLFDYVFKQTVNTIESSTNLSSFGTEVISLQNVIKSSGFNLYLLDEFGRGTNPAEGQALFYAVLEFFAHQTDTILIATTHYTVPSDIFNCSYFQMIGLDDGFYTDLSQNRNLCLNEKLKLIHKYMNYQPVRVLDAKGVPHSALHIAELLGLEAEIVKKASVNRSE